MEEQRKIIVATLKSDKNLKAAWQAFGKLTHAGQDFYAHSNYVQLWVTEIAPDPLPPPSQINPLDPNILAHPKLHSGKIYFWDWVAFIPDLHHLGAKMTPKDSHSNMNLDHPQRSPLFPYVLQAAIQRTAFEFNQIGLMLNPKELLRFIGK